MGVLDLGHCYAIKNASHGFLASKVCFLFLEAPSSEGFLPPYIASRPTLTSRSGRVATEKGKQRSN